MAISGSKKGLGRSSSEYMTGGDSGRPTPAPQQQNSLFYIGIVMDDADDHGMGRVWVYIPRLSSKRFGDHATNDYGGTVPDRETGRLVLDTELRTGWFPCYPLLPFAGTDFSRIRNSPTGRNGREGGHSNSYGLWCQPRIGDHVGILFDHADPGQGYWIGMVPRFYGNYSMPGVTGVQKKTLSRELNTSFYDILPETALVPSLEKINEKGSEERFTETFAASDFTNNLLQAGLISDVLRGASTSSARRESPSYVTGLKSPGWDFDSERNNYNADTGLKFDGSQVGEPPNTGVSSKYRNVATVGHQFVMDDHPDYQGVRLRTSAGSQLYFNDTSATSPFIYVATARGKVWLEFRDDGKIDVFAADSISFHATGDLNLFTDSNMNVEVGGNMRTLVKGNHEYKVNGTTSWEMDGNYSITAGGNMDVDVSGNFIQQAGGDTKISNPGCSVYMTGETINETATDIKLDASKNVDVMADNSVNVQGLASIALNGGGEIRAQAGLIWLNSGGGLPPFPATEGPTPNTIPQTPLDKQPGPPTQEQILSGGFPAPIETTNSRLPQHQPWINRSDKTGGFNGFVDENTSPATAQQGAARDDATKPLNFVGYVNGGDDAKAWRGVPYSSQSIAEAPQYEEIRDPNTGELQDVLVLSPSQKLIEFLHTKEGLVIKDAYLDAGVAWAIGYGHNIKTGDVINGTLAFNGETQSGEFRVGSDFIGIMNRTEGRALSITKDEADRIFLLDLQKFESGIKRLVQVNLTQGQYDALVSFTYNIGLGGFGKSTLLKRINSKNFQDVPREWRKWNKSRNTAGQRVVHPGLDKRRQEELELFWAASEGELSANVDLQQRSV